MTGGPLRVAVLDDWEGIARDCADWDSLGTEVEVFAAPIPPAERAARLTGFDVICAMRERTPFPAELIRALPRLRLLTTTGPRNAAIDLPAAAAAGVTVCATEGRGPATAQLTLALILAATRGLVPAALSMREGGWRSVAGPDLDGLTLGLVGLGRIGAQVAALARPFGMDVTAWSPNLTDARCAEAGARRAGSLAALLEGADVVSLHVILSRDTRGLIGAAELARMKPGALLVNTSRAGVVDGPALRAALRTGRPAAAALDVHAVEPAPADHADRALIDAGRLLLTPHMGYVSRQTFELFHRQTVEAIAAWAKGTPIRVLVAP